MPQSPKLQFLIDGVPLKSAPGKGQNRLSGIAYFHSKGCVVGRDRLTTEEFGRLLEKLGVANPAAPWKVRLPSGKEIEARLAEEPTQPNL